MKKRTTLKAALFLLLSFSLVTCINPLKPGLGDKVDIEPPQVSINSHVDGQYLSGAVAFEGNYSDDLKAPRITVSTDGGTTFTPASRTDSDSGVWSHDIDTTEFQDNEYEVRVRATDSAGKTTDAKVLVYFDNTAPVVLLKTPQAVAETSFNQTVSVSGDAYDPFGITRVDLGLYDGDPSASGTTQLPLRRTQSAYNQAVSDNEALTDRADGSSAWTYPFDTTVYTSGVDDYVITVAATDRAGNRATSFFHVDTLRTEIGSIPNVDDLYEALTAGSVLSGSSLGDLSSANLPLTIDQDLDRPQFEFSVPSADEPGLGANPRATGSVSDDDGVVRESIEILLNMDPASASDADWVTVSSVSGSGGRVNWEHDLTSLTQGPHTMHLRAEDVEGRLAVSAELPFAIDYGPPVVTIDSPAPGSYHNGDITLTGEAQDGAGIDLVEVSSDGGATWTSATLTPGSAVGPPDDRNWSYTATAASLSEGAVTFRVRAVDVALKESTESVQVSLDLTDPGLVFLAPSGGDEVNGTILVQGTGDDRSPFEELLLYDVAYGSIGSATPIARLDSGTNSFDPDGGGNPSSYYRWYKAIDTTAYQILGDPMSPNPPETVTFTILARDDSGNEGYEEVTVSVDQASDIPEITLDTLSLGGPGTWVFGTSTSLVGTLTDDDSIDASTVQYSLVPVGDSFSLANLYGAGESDGLSKRWSIPLPSSGGEYKLRLEAQDINGQSTSLQLDSVILDSGPPAITETASGATSTAPIYRNVDVPLGGTVTDGFSVDSVVVTYSKDGGPPVEILNDTDGNETWATTLTAATGDGAYEITVTATDGAGASSTLVRNIVVDTSPVELEVTDPVDGALVDTGTYTIVGRVTDSTGQGVDALQYSLDNATWTDIPITGLNWSTTIGDYTTGGQGQKTLYVRATDGLNGDVEEQVSFSYDTAAPGLSETGIDSVSQEIRGATFTLEGTASDSNELESVTIDARKDGGPWAEVHAPAIGAGLTSYDYSYEVSLTGAGTQDGAWEYRITAADTAGRQTIVNRAVLIDETAPTEPTIDPFVGSYVVDELVSSGNAGDAGSGVSVVEYAFNPGGPWSSATGTSNWFKTVDISATGANLGEGSHDFYVRSTDRAGNVSTTASLGFVVDRSVPDLTINGYTGTVYRNGPFTIDGTLTDSLELGSGGVTITASRSGTPVTLAAPTLNSPDLFTLEWSQDIPTPGDGDYLVTITGRDDSGQTVIGTRTITVDSVAPNLTSISLAGGEVLNNAEYTVTGTYADAVSGTAEVEYSTDYAGDPATATWITATGSASWSATLSSLPDDLGQTFAVRARDNAGNVSAPEVRTFDVDTAAPTLAVTGGNTAPTLVYRNSDITLTGTASDANGDPTVTVSYSKDGGSDVTIFTGVTSSWTSTLDLDAGPDNVAGNGDDGHIGDGEFVFTIIAEDTVGKTTELSRSVRIDTAPPSAEVTSVSPVVEGTTVNGVVTVRALLADDIALESTEWALLAQSAGAPTDGNYAAVTGSKTAPQFVIDTTAASANVVVNGAAAEDGTVVNGQTSVLWIRGTDRAGNSYEVSQELSIDQGSDTPQISFTTLDGGVTDPANSYLNLIESNGLIRFTITDDDLVDSSSIEVSVGDATSWQTLAANGQSTPADTLSVTANYDLYSPSMLTEGTTSLYLRVSDEGSAKSGIAAVQSQVGPIYLMVDRNFPTVTESTLGGDVFRSTFFDLGGTVSDTNALKWLTVTESKDGADATTALDTALSGTSDSWSVVGMPDNGSADDGEYLYTITVTDGSDKQTVLTRTVTIDTTNPLAAVVTNPVADAWLNSSTFIFSGTASDGTGSGIESVYFTETARGAGPPAQGDPSWENASVDGSGNWTASVSIGGAGEREFHVYSEDAAGNLGSVTTHNFGLDQANPSASVTGGSATSYVNSDFTIDGTFSDASGLASVDVEVSFNSGAFSAATPATATFDNGTGNWGWNKTLGGETDGNYDYRFTFTDNAGNSSQLTKSVNLDRLAPTISFTDSTPSITFDGPGASAAANGTMSLSGAVTEDPASGVVQSLSYRVDGGPYSALPVTENFTITGIDTTAYSDLAPLPIDVRAIDRNGNESVEQFTFNVDQSTDLPLLTISSPTAGSTINSTSVTVSGSIVDDDGVTGDPGTVQYRYSPDGTVGGYGTWQDVAVTGVDTSRSFSYTISSASDGSKLLEMRAIDENGTTSTPVEINFSFDTDEPEITGLSPAEGSYFNGNFVLSGTASDDSGDVELLRYRVERDDGSSVTEIISWTNIPGPPAASIPFSVTIDTTAGTGTYEVFLEASDGTFTREKSVTVYVDKTAPVATFGAPTGGSTQNNIINISGGSSDNFGVQSVLLRVVDTLSNEQPLPTGTVDVSNPTSWSVTAFDTRNATLESYASTVSPGVYELTLRAIATDLAGNSSSTDLTFQIDQSQDNPVVTVNNIATDGSSTIQTTTISGNVLDDDGVSAIEVATWDVGNSTMTPSRTETVTLTSGTYGGTDLDWRITLASNGNGLRAIRVRAVDVDDNNGQDFSATDYSRTDTGKIEFQLDTEDPEVAVTSPSANITWSSNNSFDVTGTSLDETGVTSLAYKLDDNDFSSGTTSVSAPFDNWGFTIPEGDLADGPHTIYVQATDSVGNTRIASRQISVDKTAPTISITAPANGSDVYGPLTIGGTAADNPGGAGVASIAVGLGKQIDPGDLEGSTWTAVPGTTSWSFSFANINDYANTTYSVNTGDTDGDGVEEVGETWTDLWDFTFYVRAIDGAGEGAPGNAAYLTSYTVTIDPKRDRPEITVFSPEDASTVGGFVRVFGSAFDGQFVDRVEIAIDANNNGDYSDDTWSEGTEVDYAHEAYDGATWYLADGTTSWNVRLNEAGEFDPSGSDTRTIRFKVRAWDYKTTPSSLSSPGDGIPGGEVEYSVTFNKSFPRFEDISLASGSTVGGTVTLTGIVRDESDISRIVFSNEGPLLDNTVIFDSPGTTVVQSTTNPYGGSDITVTPILSGDPDYDAAFPGSYRINVPIDTTAPGLYANGAGSMSVRITAEDTTANNPYTNQNLISFNVDNIAPSDLTYTGDSEILGTEAELMGTVRDTGTVSGISRIVVYVTNGSGEIVRLQGGSGTIGSFTETEVLDEENTSFSDYRMVIDEPLEDGNDSVGGGDNDGIPEFLTISAGTYQWSGILNSTLVDDGAVTVHYVAEDFAGNTTGGTTSAFVANNRPSIDSVILGTDLNGDGDVVDTGEKSSEITAGFGTTGYSARNNRLYFEVGVTGGNGTLRYSVWYDTNNDTIFDPAEELNATLINNTLTVDSSFIPDSATENDRLFRILVYDSTTSDDADATNELTDTVTVGLTIDNVDEQPPSIDLSPLGQSWTVNQDHSAKTEGAVTDYLDNLVTTGSGLSLEEFGYVQYASDSNDAVTLDADISGRVVFLGRAYDNQRIQRITAQIADYDGGNGVGSEFDVATWNGSALVTAGGDLSTVAAGTDPWGFEVVPGSQYITEANGHVLNWKLAVDTSLIQTVASTDLSVIVRVYDTNPANDGSPGTDSGTQVDVVPYITRVYNPVGQGGLSEGVIRSSSGRYVLANRPGNSFRAEGYNLGGATAYVTAAPISAEPGAGGLTVTANTTNYADIEKNLTSSGYLTLFVNGVASINNQNKVAAPYNSEIDTSNPRSTQWTDDRRLLVWNLTEVMSGILDQTFYYPSMAMNGNQPLFSYSNDNNGYTYRTTGDTNSAFRSGAWFERHTALARTAGGQEWIASVQDAFDGNGVGYLYVNRDRQQNALLGGNPQTNTRHFEIQGLDYLSTQLNRIKYPKLHVDGPDNATNVYLTYYDSHPGARELNFVSFRATDATNSNLTQPGNDNGRATQVQTIPGTSGASSEYFDMVKVNGTDVAVVYFDQNAGSLKMQYSSDAWDANNLSGGGNWTEQVMDASPLTGSHVSAAVGQRGGTTYLYVAYQDAAATSLKFAEVNWGTKAVNTVQVDSQFSVGTRTNVHVINEVPHIAYSADSYVGTGNSIRLAYPVAANGRTAAQNITQDGADQYDQFTGNWEVLAVPTVRVPRPGIEQFHRTMINQHNDGTEDLPLLAWLADRIEYGRMLGD